MNLLRLIKNNLLLRGCYMLYRQYFGLKKSSFGYIADSVIITPPILIDECNCYIYEHVSIGANAHISTPNAKIIIKEHVQIADHFTVHTGNHVRQIGLFIDGINESNKPVGNDEDVIIDNDVWIGSNVTLLSGVFIGRGSTIAAGAVVNKSVPPYSLVGGIPARVLKFKWSLEEILEHEEKLYPMGKRYSKEYLESLFKKYV